MTGSKSSRGRGGGKLRRARKEAARERRAQHEKEKPKAVCQGKLGSRQLEFVTIYEGLLAGGKSAADAAQEAAEQAGVFGREGANAGTTALTNKRISMALQERRKDVSAHPIRIVLTAPLCREESEGLLAEIARKEGGYKGPERLKAIQLDGMMRGYFVERKSIEHKHKIADIEKMTAEQLAALIAAPCEDEAGDVIESEFEEAELEKDDERVGFPDDEQGDLVT